MKRRLLKRKGFNEIYFVLYLVAVILLIPDKKNHQNIFLNDNTNSNKQTNVYLSPEKINLNCFITQENGRTNIKELDSINYLKLIGEVINISYSVEIKKNNISQTIPISDNGHISKLLTIEKINNNLKFTWKPNIKNISNQNFIVNISGIAKVKNQNQNIENINLKSSFGLNIFFNDNLPLFTSNDSLLQELLKSNSNAQKLDTDAIIIDRSSISIDIIPEIQSMKGIALEPWSNNILVIGMNLKKDLLSTPKLFVNSEDGQNSLPSINQINENSINISGYFPKYGKAVIEISLIRNLDNKEIKTSFTVNTIPIEEPIYEANIYPGVDAMINPKLPMIGKSISAIIKSGNQIIYKSNDGAIFNYKPRDRDTNETLTLERYIDNKLVGKTYQILVLNLPEPKIIKKIKKDDNTYLIQVRTFGYFNGERNTSKIVLDQSLASVEEKYALYKEDKNSTIQVFSIKIQTKLSKKAIKLIAQDKRNYKSTLIYLGE